MAYSGRLLYHQACASIIITPPPAFLMHTTHLMRPLFSSSLPLSHLPPTYPSAFTNITWPRSFPPSKGNVVFVSPDWSDLEQTVSYLRTHPAMAKSIAQRQRELMVEAGYLSPAAEVCYWRALIRGWSRVANPKEDGEGGWGKWSDEGIEKEEGMRWETFTLMRKTNWD